MLILSPRRGGAVTPTSQSVARLSPRAVSGHRPLQYLSGCVVTRRRVLLLHQVLAQRSCLSSSLRPASSVGFPLVFSYSPEIILGFFL